MATLLINTFQTQPIPILYDYDNVISQIIRIVVLIIITIHVHKYQGLMGSIFSYLILN